MKKSMKGTIAIAAAIALLLGGGGSLAYWQSSATTSAAAPIQSGELNVTVSTGTWQVTRGTTTTTINPATFKMVPGDVVTYTVPFQTVAQGTNLTAAGTIAWGGYTGIPAHLTSSTTGSTYNGAAIAAAAFTVVPNATTNGSLVFTLTWPFGTSATNDTAAATMNKSWNLGATTVTVQQTANGATP